jgi:SAM-dependent methyltransferase
VPARRLAAEVKNIGVVPTLRQLPRYVRDLRRFRALGGDVDLKSLYPILGDRTASHPVEPQYLHQAVWLAHRVVATPPKRHVDVGSHLPTVAMLTSVTDVTFIDLRTSGLRLDRFTEQQGTALALPFADASVESLSCLHVAEHIGLGRYGDDLDPQGTERVARELARVLAPGGVLYVSLPIGTARVEFNAHRVFQPDLVPGMFPGLQLVEYSMVDPNGQVHRDVPLAAPRGDRLALGLFRLTRG